MELLDTLAGFTESERQTGARLLKLATEIDRIEGYIEPHAVAVTALATRIGERMGLHGADPAGAEIRIPGTRCGGTRAQTSIPSSPNAANA